MAEQTYKYDPTAALDTEEAVNIFLNDAFETENPAYITEALGLILRAKDISQTPQADNLNREQLYKTLSSEENPTFTTVINIMKSLGFSLTFKHSS